MTKSVNCSNDNIQIIMSNDKKLQAIIYNAKTLNLNANELKVLYCINNAGSITQRDIERTADLRQPEVSLAIRGLSSSGILGLEIQQNPNKGRPVNVYTLKKPVSEYITAIKKQKEHEWMIIQLALDDLAQQFSK